MGPASRAETQGTSAAASDNERLRPVRADERADAVSISFDELYVKYRSMVAATAWHILGAQGEIEDVVQNVFIEVFRSIDRFRGEAALSTWLYRITVNVALQEVRRRSRKRWLRLFTGEDETDQRAWQDPRKQIESRSALSRLGLALDKVSPKKRAVFVLVEVEGLSPQEAADILNVPLNTVRSRLIAARSEVTARLAKEGALNV
jgi:RNA polymerase sigma-70 factor (ECF subfamily)